MDHPRQRCDTALGTALGHRIWTLRFGILRRFLTLTGAYTTEFHKIFTLD